MKQALLAMAAMAAALPAGGQTRAADLARALKESRFDTEECYRVRDASLVREDLKLYLNEGVVMFAKPVEGRTRAALFAADDGDGEVLLLPPNRGERASLASFTGSPNLDEHITGALLIFTDNTAAELKDALRSRGEPRKSPEMGLVLAPKWDAVLQNFMSSLQVHLVADGLARRDPAQGLFYVAVSSTKLGNFDVMYDPSSREQVTAGQVVFRDDRAFFDIWTSFPARSYRTGQRQTPPLGYAMTNIRIEATLDHDLHMKAMTRATITARERIEGLLAFELSRRVRIQAVRLDGEPIEAFQRESLRANLVRGPDNETILVVPNHPLAAGSIHEIEFEHEGDVITEAGNKVYYVGARGTWYPHVALEFSTYDLTFRYPRELNLVATGDVVEERNEGEWRITRRRTATPIRCAGFNLGVYDKAVVKSGGYTVELYANHKAEPLINRMPATTTLPWPGHRRPGEDPGIASLPRLPEPLPRLQQLASEVASAFEYLASVFGPPPLKTLTVSPIPGSFGQGFPGLIYLSTVTYLPVEQRPGALRDPKQTIFFSDTLAPHEAAHQWWGNLVITASYQDDWIMEAIANYAAVMYLEKRKGVKALDTALDYYRHELLVQTEGGATIESTGPITWGTRLARSQAPDAWRTITYDKGAWILHMLRRRLGDEGFLAMLRDLRRQFEYKALGTDDLRQFAARYLPPRSADPKLEDFFEQWVQGTGIPTLKLTYSVKGKAPNLRLTGSVAQSDVAEDFSALVPVVIQFPRGRAQVQWVRTGTDAPAFTVALKQAPVRVAIDTGSVLAR